MNYQKYKKFRTISRQPRICLAKPNPTRFPIKPDQYYNNEDILGLSTTNNNCSLDLIPENELESEVTDSGNDDEDEKQSYFLSSSSSPTDEDDKDSLGEISSKLQAYLHKIDKLKTLLNQNSNCRDKSNSTTDPLDQLLELTKRHQAGLNEVIQVSDSQHLSNSKGWILNNRYFPKSLQHRERDRDDDLSSGDEPISYASSSNEAAHLQQRLKNLSTELVTLRNRLNPTNNNPSGPIPQSHPPSPPLIPPPNRGGRIPFGYPNKPLPPNPPSTVTASSLSNVSTTQGSCYLSVPVHGSTGQFEQNPGVGYYANEEFATTELTSPGNPYATTYETKPSSASLIIGTDGCGSGSTRSVSSSSSIQMSNKSCSSSIGGSRKNSSMVPPLPIKNFRQIASSSNGNNVRPITIPLAEIEDCIHLPGALTEDALIRCLQARCANSRNYVYMGPILLLANPFTCLGNSLTLSSTQHIPIPLPIQKVVNEALRQQAETGYPQAIILNGCSGSGKTYSSMLVLRQLFETASGGGVGGMSTESDAFKHLTASITVLRSLGTARTLANAESSRIGHFIEVQVTDGTLYRTKVHCYFLDQNRVVKTKANESNYHIFYQLLAGLGKEERAKLNLGEHTIKTLRYLNNYQQNDEAEDARRFMEWKSCLSLLGIPFLDVVRVLCAVLLIGNVQFVNSSTSTTELELEGSEELQAVASLLGVSESALRQGLTTRTHNARNQLIRSHCDANLSNFSRDSLAKSLYCRTVATIVRRANSLKRLNIMNSNAHSNNKNIVPSSAGTLTSSDSADSINNQNHNNCQFEVSSQHASTVGTAGSKASKSMTALNNAVRHATDGFIGVLDLFGFEEVKESQLEHLCINLCAETMQHFYNTHIFKACIESCREENIQCDWEVDYHYHDNVPCIDLISSLRTGLLSMLDVECSTRGTVESYVQKIRSQHSSNSRLVLLDNNSNSNSKSIENASLRSTFGIQHYGGKVYYDASDFLETNRDVLPDDLVAVFHKHRCSFGFASHLFSSELKVLGGSGSMEPCPKGISFRISPTSHTDLLNGNEPVSTLTQDFHTRLDNLLRTLVHAKPHFLRCIKINQVEQRNLFDRHTVSKQLRSFQVLETVNLMAHGYPHRMRFKSFNTRFKLLAGGSANKFTCSGARMDENTRLIDESKFILEEFDLEISKIRKNRTGANEQISMGWAIGSKHVFLSEGARQELENLRNTKRNQAATLIQSTWRGWYCRRRWPIVRQSVQQHFQRKSMKMRNGPNPMDNGVGHYLNATEINEANGQGEEPPFPHSMNPRNYKMEHISPTHSTIQLQQPIQISQLVPPGASIHRSSASASIITTNNNNYKNVYPASSSIISGPMGDGINSNLDSIGSSNNGSRPRPQPISGTPPPEVLDSSLKDSPTQTTSPPPQIPPSRSYTVVGNNKITFPQTRVVKIGFPDGEISSEIRLLKGETVQIVGCSPRRGHLIVDHRHRTLHVPFQYLELKI